jgi:predicted TIM-barrel enzyme
MMSTQIQISQTDTPAEIETAFEGLVLFASGVSAGGLQLNHAEGVVVATPIKAGGPLLQHAEGVVVATPIKAGGPIIQHAEGVVAP